MKLRWSPRSLTDLLEIRGFIALDDAKAAERWVARLRLRVRALVSTPLAGRVVPEIADPAVREVLVGRYRLVYRVEVEVVTVLTVFEGHRSWREG